MSDKTIFGELELVEVRLDDYGNPSFFFSTRDGWADLGTEIRMTADNYAIGTRIELRGPLK